MAEADPKTSGSATDATQGGSVGGTVGRVVFLLAAGTLLFYALGRMTADVRGVEREAARESKERASNAVPPRSPKPPIPELPRMSPYPRSLGFAGGDVFLFNGAPRRIATFQTHDRPDVVAAWYEKAWQAAGLSPFGMKTEDSAQASAMDLAGNLRYTVMAQWIAPSSMTVTHLSVSTVTPVVKGFQKTQVPLPEGAVPMMDLQASGGAGGSMIGYILPVTSGAARDQMIAKLREAGWKYEDNYSPPPNENGYCVMFFSHGDRLLTLSLDPLPEGRSSMIVSESVDLE